MPNSHNPNISIVIATYNGAKYLREQLDSIAAQTMPAYEIIIQDDCSEDETVAIIESYSSKLPIKLFQNPQNLGYIRNFESALSKAQGEFIALCDQDDVWKPEKLEWLMQTIGTKSLAYADSMLIDSDGNPIGKTLSKKLRNRFIEAPSPLCFVYDNCVSAHAILLRRSLLKHLFPFPRYLYFDAWIAACAASHKGIGYIDEPLVGYRQHASNTLSIHHKPKRSFLEKMFSKVAKKREEHASRAAIIGDLLRIMELDETQRNVLIRLQQAHASFDSRWFNLGMFFLLVQYRSLLFAITRRNSFALAFKKSIGLKLYRFLPFL